MGRIQLILHKKFLPFCSRHIGLLSVTRAMQVCSLFGFFTFYVLSLFLLICEYVFPFRFVHDSLLYFRWYFCSILLPPGDFPWLLIKAPLLYSLLLSCFVFIICIWACFFFIFSLTQEYNLCNDRTFVLFTVLFIVLLIVLMCMQ